MASTISSEDAAAAPAEAADGPVLDLNDAQIKKLLSIAKRRGFVTYDELAEMLPSEEFSSEKIEDTLAMLSDLGINVEDAEESEEPAAAEEPEEAEEQAPQAKPAPQPRPTGRAPCARP